MLRPLLAAVVLAALAAPSASAAVVFNDAHLALTAIDTAHSFFNATATAPESNGFRLFADTDQDGQVSEEEADAMEQQFAEQATASMNGSEEERGSVLYDGKAPTEFQLVEIESEGLVGPTTSTSPIRLYLVVAATYDIDESAASHTIVAEVEDEMGNTPTRVTAPPGFVVSTISGLPGATPGAATVNGTSSGGEAINATFTKASTKTEDAGGDNVPAPGALVALLAAVGVALARRQRRT